MSHDSKVAADSYSLAKLQLRYDNQVLRDINDASLYVTFVDEVLLNFEHLTLFCYARKD